MTANSQSSLPQPFLDRMAGLLGDEYAAFLASCAAARDVGLRVNTLKLTPGRLRALAPFSLTPAPWSPDAFLVPEDAQPGKHPYHAAGLYYLQDPSAMIPAALLDPQPGERVLDMAAAPGGKATHIAALMGDSGLLVANEIHPKRVWALAENLERWGVRNAVVTNETPERLADCLAGFFDRVLLDAPCSGEGMMFSSGRKGEAARVEWAPELVQGCALRQSTILADAGRLVRPGGRLVYSTCTFAPEENEGTVARFLRDHPDFELIDPARRPGFGPGRPDWLPEGERMPGLEWAVRLWPHTGPGEGHFIAVLEKRLDVERADVERSGWRCEPLPRPLLELYAAFCRETLTAIPAEMRLALVGAYLYALPAGLPALSAGSGRGPSGLRFIHPGWWLGTFKKNRFEPSHALALGLRPEDARRAVDLSSGGAGVLIYLRGETLANAGEDGWTLVTVDGFPLGWGKRVGGRLKSRYPRGLRRF